jgi:hypothetical protein
MMCVLPYVFFGKANRTPTSGQDVLGRRLTLFLASARSLVERVLGGVTLKKHIPEKKSRNYLINGEFAKLYKTGYVLLQPSHNFEKRKHKQM